MSDILDPDFLEVRQNVPNPFGQTTTIRFEVRARQHVSVRVYDVGGRFVASLMEDVVDPGPCEARWDGSSWTGHEVSSGLYFLRVRTDRKAVMGKMLLIR